MRVNINQIKEMKKKGDKIAMLTAYDYPTAKIVDEAGIPLILVGDSLGMVILGYESTIPVTMAEMLHHTKAVVRGSKKAMVIGDMPFMSYHTSVDDALRNAALFLQEAGAIRRRVKPRRRLPNCSRTPRPWKRPAPLPSSWKRCPPRWLALLARESLSPPLALVPVSAVMVRFRCSATSLAYVPILSPGMPSSMPGLQILCQVLLPSTTMR